MRICSKNANHRRLGATRCEVAGCGALVIEAPDPPVVVAAQQPEPPPPEPTPTGPTPTGPTPTGPTPTGPAPTGPAPTGPAPTGPAGDDQAAVPPPEAPPPPDVPKVPENKQPVVPPPETSATPDAPHIVSAGIDWPWGFVVLADYLPIGRDPAFSPLAARLDKFAGVADRHAEIRRRGGGFVLRDLGSGQATFLAGQALPPQQDFDLANGANLRFGSQAKARVRFSQERK